MSKKHQKLHRHRHPSKNKLHRRLKKELIRESVLEPIHEIPKEKIKIDKNGCGDHIHSSEKREQLLRYTDKKRKHSKSKRNKNEERSIIDKKKSSKEKSVRHQSLEKNENHLLDKAKILFRKEKSFNDAIQKTTDSKYDKTENLENKKERKRKHRHKEVRNSNKTSKETELPNNNESTSEANKIQPQIRDFNKVQEVIYCHMSQNPYEMKNDKNAKEVEDLYRRLKRERHKEKEKNKEAKHRSHSHANYDHVDCTIKYNKEGHSKERSKTPKTIEHNDVTRGQETKRKNISPTRETHRNKNLSLGPYEKYFAFEKKYHNEHCKKHHREETTSKPTEKKQTKHEEKKDAKKGTTKIEENQIRDIVERNLKSHLDNIQVMINKKLDVLLQIKKDKREARKKDKEQSEKEIKNTVNNKQNSEEKKKGKSNMNLAKEEIIQEVLKRLKEEPQQEVNTRKTVHEHNEKTNNHKHVHDNPDTESLQQKFQEAKDSLECIKFHLKPALGLTTPTRDERGINKSKRQQKNPCLTLPLACASMSSYKTTCRHPYQLYSASEENIHSINQNQKKLLKDPKTMQNIYPDPIKQRIILKGTHQSVVQEIEQPPAKARDRKFECKTVSIIGIPPRVEAVNQTQTSNKSHKSSVTDRDLLEKKKESKRFKFYYKYSSIDNAQECNDGSSEAKSIVSDSYKFVSDPSEEYVVNKGPKKDKRPRMELEVPQIPQNVPKKWNRISSSRDFHLKNISEEPSIMSIPSKDQDYFIPLRGTKEYYSRALSSSHSDYCFKVDKKHANSNISFHSKDAWDSRFYNRKFKYYSRSDLNLLPSIDANCLPKSKSDVFLDEISAQKILRTIFLEDIQPFIKSRHTRRRPRQYSRFKNVLKEILTTSCKECQTTTETEFHNSNDESFNVIAEDAIKIMENKQKQFQEIHKTIDFLEKNIQASKHVRPKTVDAIVSSIFTNTERAQVAEKPISKKTIAIQTAEDVPVKKVNTAVGSFPEHRQGRRARTFHHVAVGGDSEIKIPAKTPRSKSRKAQTENVNSYRTAALSPIRIKEEIGIQISSRSPESKAISPQTPKRKQPLINNKVIESKISNNTETQTSNAKTNHKKSPIRSKLNSNEVRAKTPQNVDTLQKPVSCLRAFRNREKRFIVKKDSSDTHAKESNKIKNIALEEVSISQTKRESNSCNNITNDESQQKKPISEILSSSVNEACFLHHTPVIQNNNNNSKTIVVNTCNPLGSPQVNITETKSSTSSSVSDALPHQTMRKSKSLGELSSHKSDFSRSKSDLSYFKNDFLNAQNMEKYTTKPNLKYQGPKFDESSLDQYIGNKLISTLFLTKDYKGATISAYQKRKLYDQSIRQKMKKKFPKIDVRPQIFEVRFLSTDNEQKRVIKDKEKPNLEKVLKKKDIRKKRSLYSKPHNCISRSLTKSNNDCEATNVILEEDTSKITKNDSGGTKYESTTKQVHEVEELFLTSYNNQSSDSTQSTEPNPTECLNQESPTETSLPVLLQPMSCPILGTNSSSFEFLYEEIFILDDGSVSRDLHETCTFSTKQYNAETPFYPEIYGKTSGSLESGYASVTSKNCCSSSLTNFFKKPHIAALFKPPVLPWKKSNPSKVIEYGPVKNIFYEEMAEKCHLYAKKVRQCSEIQLEKYQEFPLNVLLGKASSTVLDNNNSIENEQEEEDQASSVNTENYKKVTINNKIADLIPEEPTWSYSRHGCKLILNNHCLNIKNVTYLGPEIFVENNKNLNRLGSSTTIDISLDSTSALISNSDVATHTFLTSLIKVNEKETDICNKLYHNKSFEETLLEAVKERKNKKGGFCKLFAKKPPKCLEIVPKVNFQVQEKQAIRLKNLATNAKKCFTMLAEAVKINGNIDKELKICGLLRLLERIEDGDFEMVQNKENENFEAELRFHIKEAFVALFNICQKEAKKYKKRITEHEIQLIKLFVIKYRIGLLSKTNIVASYISRGFIQTEDQLKAAVTFLIRSRSNEFNIKKFEEYCKIAK